MEHSKEVPLTITDSKKPLHSTVVSDVRPCDSHYATLALSLLRHASHPPPLL